MDNLSRSERLAAWLCGMGFLLLVAGYWAVGYRPLTPEEEETERVVREELLPHAEEAVRQNPGDEQIRQLYEEMRDYSIRRHKTPPYRWPGTIALTSGGIALAVGILLWLRRANRRRPSRWVKANEDV